mmetsp:Transcript_26015/g.44866  ORF Transcript_26015/g.44866 Transcript_26015/m.44866 type:complete len:87 (-) Transcript_26015:2-262(-)
MFDKYTIILLLQQAQKPFVEKGKKELGAVTSKHVFFLNFFLGSVYFWRSKLILFFLPALGNYYLLLFFIPIILYFSSTTTTTKNYH